MCKTRWELTREEGAFRNGEFEVYCECADTILEELERQPLLTAALDLLVACKWAARGEHHWACEHYKNPNKCDCYVGAAKAAIEAAEGVL